MLLQRIHHTNVLLNGFVARSTCVLVVDSRNQYSTSSMFCLRAGSASEYRYLIGQCMKLAMLVRIHRVNTL